MFFSLGNGSILFTIPLFLNNVYKVYTLYHIPFAVDGPSRLLDIRCPEDDNNFLLVTRFRVELESAIFFQQDFAGRGVSRLCNLGLAHILRHMRGTIAIGQV
jgi:hypothetical protein